MTDKIEKTYGPFTMEFSRFGWFTRFVIWFLPTYIHETPDGIVVYKRWQKDMYILGAVRKPTQAEQPRLS